MSENKDNRNINELDDNQLEQVSGGLVKIIISPDIEGAHYAGGIVGYSDNSKDFTQCTAQDLSRVNIINNV